jgi:ATP-dependent helicase HrpB
MADELPIEPYLPEIARRLLGDGALVLAAEPGAGKTSLVPPALAEALASASSAKVLVMEPRRVAAIAAASRIAEIWGKKLGEAVGYRVRGDSMTSPRVRVEAVTPGVLLRMIQEDPGLEDVGCLVLDEFHERSAQADLALALLSQSRELRPELRLLAMSATIDSAKAATALGASQLEVPGRSFPIFTKYIGRFEGDRPLNFWHSGDRPLNSEIDNAIAHSALDLLNETDGDILVFLPGAAEIGRAAAAFSKLKREVCPPGVSGGSRAEAVVLHGSLPLEAQRRILSPPPGSPPRAIFATSIAETSLTVPRVRAVLDSGLARFTRFQPRTGLNRMVTEREAEDRADQRRGRAGRLGPGICLRAWPATESLNDRTEPELMRAELSGLVLEAALWGSPRRLDLPWLDPPPEGAWAAGTDLLLELGAITADLSPTAFGRRMAALGTDPRLSALVLRGAEAGEGWTACLAAALLSDRGPSGLVDIAQGIEELDSGYGAAPILAEAGRLARSAGLGDRPRARQVVLGPLLAAAFPDRIGERFEYRGANASFRIPAGRALRASGPLAQSEWIVALEAEAGAGATEGKIYSAYALGEAEARAVLELHATEVLEVEWRGIEPRVSLVRRAGAIVLGRRSVPRPPRAEIAGLVASRLASEGLSILPWSEGAAEELARLRYFAAKRTGEAGRGLDPASLSDASLVARAADWLAPHLFEGGGPVIDGAALARAVAALAPRDVRASIEREAPKRLELPSHSSKPIDYRGPGGPFVEARVQEFFGLAAHPRVCGEALVLRLLDPGGKPLQVTSDLPSFWSGSWAEARKQLRGRYPKHDWPEDPAAAAPSRSGIKKGRRAT